VTAARKIVRCVYRVRRDGRRADHADAVVHGGHAGDRHAHVLPVGRAVSRERAAGLVTWWGWHLPALLEAAVILVLGLIMLGIAIWEFSTSE
jgi:hypothetical protein